MYHQQKRTLRLLKTQLRILVGIIDSHAIALDRALLARAEHSTDEAASPLSAGAAADELILENCACMMEQFKESAVTLLADINRAEGTVA